MLSVIFNKMCMHKTCDIYMYVEKVKQNTNMFDGLFILPTLFNFNLFFECKIILV